MSLKGVPQSEAHKRKLSEVRKGKIISKGTREKLSLAIIKAWRRRKKFGVFKSKKLIQTIYCQRCMAKVVKYKVVYHENSRSKIKVCLDCKKL